MIKSKLNLVFLVFFVVLNSGSVFAEHFIYKVHVSSRKIDVSKNEKTVITFETSKPSKSQIFFYDQTFKKICSLSCKSYNEKHKFVWNGFFRKDKDLKSQICIFRIQTTDKAGSISAYDPHLQTGGRDVLAYWPRLNSNEKKINFKLARDSLVRLRVGLKDGPMLATVADWIPFKKGKPEVDWDGFDASGTADYSTNKNLKFHVQAISLPENYIHIINSKSKKTTNYANSQWLKNAIELGEQLNADKYRIAQKNCGTKCESSFSDSTLGLPLDKAGCFVVKEKGSITLNCPEIPKDIQAGQFYEAVFYIDGYMVGEKQITGSKVSYEFDPKKIKKGIHNFVVNIILGSSRVTTASVKIKVK